MEPSVNPPLPAGERPAAMLGELVVGNGKLSGTRRCLTEPYNLIGQSPACEVRINHDKIAPFHCVLTHGPEGFVVRDLGSPAGTRVNGESIQSRALQHGDRLDVGPYQLILALPNRGQKPAAPATPPLDSERDALRIQAAAVVAQQAELTEDELRLQQRRDGLERQEEQLADHLEEKRRHLVALREQVKAERDAFRLERANEERKREMRQTETEQAYTEADAERKQAQKERARFFELRKRLKERWDKHFAAQEALFKQRAQKLDAEASRLASEAEKQERVQTTLHEQRLRLNGEMELGRRQLEEGWQQLSLSQQEWEVCLNQEKADYERRVQEIVQREQTLERAARDLAEEQRVWAQNHAERDREEAGLEARIRNQRQKLHALEQTLAKFAADLQARPEQSVTFVLPPPPASPITADATEAPVALKRLADALADQRVHLLEQWRAVLELQDQWHRQRAILLDELEVAGRRQADTDQRLAEREQHLAVRQTQLDLLHNELSQLHSSVEGRQARLAAAALNLEAERVRIHADSQAAEEALAARTRRSQMHRRRLRKRYRAEVATLQEARQQCEEARQQYTALRAECQQRADDLLHEQQSLAGETLALERMRLEVFGKSQNTAATEKRLEKLRRQSQILVERAERELERERAALRAENVRLDERNRKLHQDEEGLVASRRKLVKHRTRWDRRRATAQEAEQQQFREMQRLLAQHEQDEKHLQALRDEVERIARLLLEGTHEGVAPSSTQAA